MVRFFFFFASDGSICDDENIICHVTVLGRNDYRKNSQTESKKQRK